MGKISKNSKDSRITNQDLNKIFIKELRKKKNKKLVNEGILGDLLKALSGLASTLMKDVSGGYKKQTIDNLKKQQTQIKKAKLTPEGAQAYADALKKAVEVAKSSYEAGMKEVANAMGNSNDPTIQKDWKGYAVIAMTTAFGDITGIMEGNSKVSSVDLNDFFFDMLTPCK